MGDERPILLFDGQCNLCNGAVRFVIERDRRARFRFCALQSAAARRLLAERGVELPQDAGAQFDTMLLIDPRGGRVYDRSGAVLRVCRGLRWPWPVFAALLLIPRPLRDLVYRFVANRRIRWFGRSESCMVPTQALRERFLDG